MTQDPNPYSMTLWLCVTLLLRGMNLCFSADCVWCGAMLRIKLVTRRPLEMKAATTIEEKNRKRRNESLEIFKIVTSFDHILIEMRNSKSHSRIPWTCKKSKRLRELHYFSQYVVLWQRIHTAYGQKSRVVENNGQRRDKKNATVALFLLSPLKTRSGQCSLFLTCNLSQFLAMRL